MPAVLVHGVPDTPELWGPLRARLERTDVITPQLPGFGISLPEGFAPSKEAYVAWLVGELEAVGAPVDLVGHDWGSLLVPARRVGPSRSRPHPRVRRRHGRRRVPVARHGRALADPRCGRGDGRRVRRDEHHRTGRRSHRSRRPGRPRGSRSAPHRRDHGQLHPRLVPLRGRHRYRVAARHRRDAQVALPSCCGAATTRSWSRGSESVSRPGSTPTSRCCPAVTGGRGSARPRRRSHSNGSGISDAPRG